MLRIAAVLCAPLLASGCLATGGAARTITSTPSGATVTIDGYGECETPCTVKLDTYRRITVAKAGYKAQRFGIEPGRQPVVVILELAAPAGDVDAETLPDL